MVLSTDDFFHIEPRPTLVKSEESSSRDDPKESRHLRSGHSASKNAPYKKAGEIYVQNMPTYKGLSFKNDSLAKVPEGISFLKADYQFNLDLIRQAHSWNQKRCEYAMEQEIPVIVIDNTNVKKWEAQYYLNFAVQFGYKVEVCYPTTSWWKDRDFKLMAERNVHGLTEEKIRSMYEGWEDVFDIDSVTESSN